MKKIWKLKAAPQDDLIQTLLSNRGVAREESEFFFDPKYEQAYDPFALADMQTGVNRILQALAKKEKICVYADYDADAVTSAAVLLRFFRHIKYEHAEYYIPDRFNEGYGINPEAITQLKDRGVSLIITVDCGINARETIEFAASVGIDVVVTDHHQLTGPLPKAAAVINPHRPDDRYPFKDLTGVGVAFKLVQALIKSPSPPAHLPQAGEVEGHPGSPEADWGNREGGRRPGEGWEKWLLDLVAIGTVADCTRILGENRIFVKWGMYVAERSKWIGLKKLLQMSGLMNTEIDTYHIGFIIAPRLNAAGRIEHANLALELLITDDEEKAQDLAIKLNELNKHRQELTAQILSEAREQLEMSRNQKILLASGEGWPKGVVGLVAGKLTEEFYRPVLILEKSGEQATGSARSIRNFNIVEAIGKSESILVKYGGHPMAAGFTIRSEHIEVFHKNLLQYAETMLSEDDLSPVLEYDYQASLSEINEDMLILLEKFAPFGFGNPQPRIRMDNLIPKFVSQIGQEGKHLRMHVSQFSIPPNVRGDKGGLLGCIGFGFGFWAEKLSEEQPIDIICEPQFNEWNGSRKIQLKIVDIDFSRPFPPPLAPKISLLPEEGLGEAGGGEVEPNS